MIDPVLISQAAIGVLARRMAVAHAPKVGVTINGHPYVGGEFIPGMTQDEVDKAAGGSSPPDADLHEVLMARQDVDSLLKAVDSFPEGARRSEAVAAIREFNPKYDEMHVFRDGDGAVVGVATAWSEPDVGSQADELPEGKYIKIRNMASARPGVGRKMVASIATSAANRGAGVYLTSLESSEGFYEKLGFHRSVGATYYLTSGEAGRISQSAMAMAVVRAPKGGVVLDGFFYRGGRFVPGYSQGDVDKAAGKSPSKKGVAGKRGNAGSRGTGSKYGENGDVEVRVGGKSMLVTKDEYAAHEDYKKNGVRSKAFKKWFGDWESSPRSSSKVVRKDGIPDKASRYSRAVDDDGNPMVVFHGTTHQFDVFDITKANIDNHFGKGFYFSSSGDDSDSNYGRIGPDLQARIDNMTDYLAGRLLDGEYDGIVSQEEYGRHADDGSDWTDVARDVAESMLVGDSPRVEKCYLNIRNPFVLGKSSSATRFDIDYNVIDGSDEDDPEYDYDNPVGLGADLIHQIQVQAEKYETDGGDPVDVFALIEDLGLSPGESPGSDELVRKFFMSPHSMVYTVDDRGDMKYASSQFLNDIVRGMGFDGVIYEDASDWFPRMSGVSKGTRHYVVFDPLQVKSVDNLGTFSTTDESIRMAVAHAPKGGVTVDGMFYPGGEFIPGKSQAEVDAAIASQASGGSVPAATSPGSWKSSVSPEEFISARNATSRPGFLSPLAPGDIANHKLFLSEDGTHGSAVSPEGDIQNVFNNGGPKGAGVECMLSAIGHGGKTLDCFDGYLPKFYTQFGFTEVGRMKFNRDYAPPGWDYEKYGEPDVVFMSLTKRGDENAIRSRVSGPKEQWEKHSASSQYYSDWDLAKSDSRRAADSPGGGGRQGMAVRRKERAIDPGAGKVHRRVVGMAVAHAPRGGVTMDGVFYVGGQFVPGHTQSEVDDASAGQSDILSEEHDGMTESEVAIKDWEENGFHAKSFKDWFGDWENNPEGASKAVASDGLPNEQFAAAKVYHGRGVQFFSFDKSKSGKNGTVVGRGFYFAENARIARTYAQTQGGDVVECYLNVRNPFIFEDEPAPEVIESFRESVGSSEGVSKINNQKRFDGLIQRRIASGEKVTGYDVWWAYSYVEYGARNFGDVLRSLGFDGLCHQSKDAYGTPLEPKSSEHSYGKCWLVFEPTQIKATDNIGTFDKNNADIRMAIAHAPKGGVSIGGSRYAGGEFIPGEVMDSATPEDRAEVSGHGGDKPSPETTEKPGSRSVRGDDMRKRQRDAAVRFAGMLRENEFTEKAKETYEKAKLAHGKWAANMRRGALSRAAKTQNKIIALQKKRRELIDSVYSESELEKRQADINIANKAAAEIEEKMASEGKSASEIAEAVRPIIDSAWNWTDSHENIIEARRLNRECDVLRKKLKEEFLSGYAVEHPRGINTSFGSGTAFGKRSRADGDPGMQDSISAPEVASKAINDISKLLGSIYEGAEWFDKASHDHIGPLRVNFMTLGGSARQRGYCDGHKDGSGRVQCDIALTKEYGEGLVWHEIGHAIEASSPHAYEACRGFWAKRTKQEDAVPLAEAYPDGGYEDDEEGNGDDFAKGLGDEFESDEMRKRRARYAGKIYPYNSEILSMGMEQLTIDPVRFAKNDPEYFDLVMMCLTGRAREW